MADEKFTAKALETYALVCAALDKRNWKYTKDEEKLLVYMDVTGDDLPMHIFVTVDADRQLLRVASPMRFKMAEDKRMDGAIAVNVANFGMADGSFDYDIRDGEIVYRQVASFRESKIGIGLIEYLIDCACATVDIYNDKFMMLNKGLMDVKKFIETDG